MGMHLIEAPVPEPAAYRMAMRHFAGNVSVITVGDGERRSGLVATSTVSLSMDPPLMLVCVNRSSSSRPLFEDFGHFGVNSLAPHHQPIAERFTGQPKRWPNVPYRARVGLFRRHKHQSRQVGHL